MRVKNPHRHISEMRIKVNRVLYPGMTKEKLQNIINHVLDGEPAPDGIIVESFYYGQDEASKDGIDMLKRGDFGFLDTNAGFNSSITKVKTKRA